MRTDILYIGLKKLNMKDYDLIENENIRIKVTNDALTGLIEIKQNTPKLVMLNLDLLKITAFDCLKIIRQNPQYYHIKVAMVSNIENYTQIENAFKLGADYFLIEPINSQTIIRILANINYQAMFTNFENVINRYNFS